MRTTDPSARGASSLVHPPFLCFPLWCAPPRRSARRRAARARERACAPRPVGGLGARGPRGRALPVLPRERRSLLCVAGPPRARPRRFGGPLHAAALRRGGERRGAAGRG